ncbi:hypothetical protein CRG98_011428 [Punica granatum]|uniref:Isopropylmalate dehydrogenase-like domain-containing protein n=1 Tax=Punica granatum TaxID=22663 RepID=A0A2I0KI48_PUNGR|nr:hypothetical protein CRG98_011428 [Punica granatum]
MAAQILRRVVGSRSTQILSSPANPTSVLPALARAFSSQTPIRATLFPGDGIGPEIAESVKQVPFSSAHRAVSSYAESVYACKCAGFAAR